LSVTIGYFLGTHEDWGGASRALLNFARGIDRNRFKPVILVTKRGQLAEELERERIDWQPWRTHDRGRNMLAYSAAVARAAAFFRKHSLGLLHINYGTIGWKPAEVLAARLLGIPIIDHLHVSFPKPSSYMRYSSAVIAVSKYVADHSDSLGVPKHVIHNISDLDRFAGGKTLRSELGYSDGDIIIAFLGQMIRVKGLEMFIEMATRIEHPAARFLVAGPMRKTEGAYTEEELTRLLQRDSRIRYIGYRTDVENIYATSDVVVMPSQWDEPCAMILFEAAAAGKPVVATATGGTPEILSHGQTGFLVDRSDVDGLARHVSQLVADSSLRNAMGGRAAALAKGSLAVDPLRQVEALYDSVMRR